MPFREVFVCGLSATGFSRSENRSSETGLRPEASAVAEAMARQVGPAGGSWGKQKPEGGAQTSEGNLRYPRHLRLKTLASLAPWR